MTGGGRTRIRFSEEADAAEIARIHMTSRLATMAYLPPPKRSLEQVTQWVREVLLTRCRTWVAVVGAEISGYAALDGDMLEHLYLRPDVNLTNGTVFVRGTKSEHAQRLLSLPPWLADRLTERAEAKGSTGLLFSSPAGRDLDKERDQRNVARVFRLVLNEAGFPWATPHTLRRTVASLLDEAGLPIALAANQLGHSDPAMTARVYLGRKGSTVAAAAVL